MSKQVVLTLSAVAAILVLVPGCGESQKPSESAAPTTQVQETQGKAESAAPSGLTGTVLMTIKGKPVITVDSLNQYKNDIIEAQPEQTREQYRQLMEVIPNAERNVFDSQGNEELIEVRIKDLGIDQSPEYKKEEQENIERFKKFNRRTLNIKKFQESIPVSVTPAEVRKYYDENKNKIGDLMISAGGVTAKAVMFDNEADAKTFYNKVSEPKADFDAVAAQEKLKVKELGSVHEQSYEVEGPMRTKILATTTFPATELVKVGDKSFAVIKMTAKEEAKYVPYDQVQGPLTEWLKQQKSGEALMKELDKLKKEYDVVVNEDYFKARAPKATPGENKAPAVKEAASAPAPIARSA